MTAGVPEPADENNIDGISLQIGVPDETQYAQLKSNEIDMTFDGSAPLGSEIPATANDPQFKDRFFSTPDAAVDYAVFKTDKAPFDNPKLRQAVNYAIDRNALTKNVLGGYAYPMDAPVGPDQYGYSAEIKPKYNLDPARAKKLAFCEM